MKRFLPVLMTAVLAGCGTDVTGPAPSLISCVFGEPITAEVGEVVQVRGAEHQTSCLAGDGASEFLYIPFYATADTSAQLALGITGAGLAGSVAVEQVGLAAAARDALRPRFSLDAGFHNRLRQREIRELEPLIRPAGIAPPVAMDRDGALVAADVPAVGELRDFNVAISCSETDLRTGRVMFVSDHAVVYADTANPATFTSQEFAFFGTTFDTLVHPVEIAHFGAPTDIDANGRSILFFTRAVNELNPAGSEQVTIGFFWSGDLFPETETDRLEACPAANQSEMFYLIAPDPQGEVGVEFSLDDVRNLAIPLIGHEFQHLINASRRLFVNQATTFEAPWLNEGLSHAAEELLYLEVSGLRSGTNLTLDSVLTAIAPGDSARAFFNRYMGSNINNFAKFLSRPDTASLMGPPNSLATRGASWNFLRYAADRSGVSDPTFFSGVVNGTDAGIVNLDAVIGSGRTLDWMRDWSVSVFADDNVPGLESRFTVTTWNLRSVYQGTNLEEYPLQVESLEGEATSSLDLMAGGTAYIRFGVPADGVGVLHVEAGDGEPPTTLRGSFLRVQ
ncbi:MAG: hypothetical protein ACN0LA_15105 [Candidatus Longimicrobiales bacterium M2_2A_002]